MESTITGIISSLPLLSAVVDSFRFGAVWILSTRRLSDVRVVFYVVDSVQFKAVWILSTRRLSVVGFVLGGRGCMSPSVFPLKCLLASWGCLALPRLHTCVGAACPASGAGSREQLASSKVHCDSLSEASYGLCRGFHWRRLSACDTCCTRDCTCGTWYRGPCE